jgi:hypothetical protein
VKDQEALKADAIFDQPADAIRDNIGDLPTDRVMTSGIIIGCIFLARYQLIRMEQLAVGTRANRVFIEIKTNKFSC